MRPRAVARLAIVEKNVGESKPAWARRWRDVSYAPCEGNFIENCNAVFIPLIVLPTKVLISDPLSLHLRSNSSKPAESSAITVCRQEVRHCHRDGSARTHERLPGGSWIASVASNDQPPRFNQVLVPCRLDCVGGASREHLSAHPRAAPVVAEIAQHTKDSVTPAPHPADEEPRRVPGRTSAASRASLLVPQASAGTSPGRPSRWVES